MDTAAAYNAAGTAAGAGFGAATGASGASSEEKGGGAVAAGVVTTATSEDETGVGLDGREGVRFTSRQRRLELVTRLELLTRASRGPLLAFSLLYLWHSL